MKIEIRDYDEIYSKEIATLFTNTIHKTCAKDYTKEQLNAWASLDIDFDRWEKKLEKSKPFLAFIDDTLVGFSEFYGDYIDCFYIHHDYQSKGVGKALINQIIKLAKNRAVDVLNVHASITAKGFFEKYGFIKIKKNIVIRSNVELENYSMQLKIS